MEVFGARLRELREEKGLFQKDIARILHTSSQNVSRWERGYFEPDQKTTVALSKFFNVTIDYLFGLENYDGTKIK